MPYVPITTRFVITALTMGSVRDSDGRKGARANCAGPFESPELVARNSARVAGEQM
jgi:hypothetical protein